MGKPIERDFTQRLGILKHFPYLGAACIVPQSMAYAADGNGRKVVKGGTPFPSNDENCVGYLFDDVDVTLGDAPGTYIYEGDIDNAKLTKNGVTIEATAKAKTPRVTFFD